MEFESVSWAVASSGKSRNPEDFSILGWFYENVGYGWRPHVRKYAFNVGYEKVAERLLQKEGSRTVFHSCAYNEKGKVISTSHIISPGKGYLVLLNCNLEEIESYSPDIRRLILSLEIPSKDTKDVLVCDPVVYCPPPDTSLHDSETDKWLAETFQEFYMPDNEVSPSVNMICQEDGDLYIRNFFFQKEYALMLPDLHYGKGFMDFHTKVLERFQKEKKGLFLFHGSPGTGKTFYIRSLIRGLIEMGKFVIYLPPDMVNQLASPEMMTFLTNTIMEKSDEGKSCVILLEDAETLLVSRDGYSRSNGISNLLNITDGLLNDMLSVQVIATFNTNLEDIDKALLRPERLIARKEFRPLSKEDAEILVKELGMEMEIKGSTTLAEIYSVKTDNEILVHDYQPERKTIGFGSGR